MSSLQGKLIRLKVGGKPFECEMDLTVNFTANTSDEDPCKPAEGASVGDVWIDSNIVSKSWDASVSAKTMVDSLTTFTGIDKLINAFVNGSNIVEVTVETNSTSGDYDQPQTMLFVGTAIMTGLTLNAPQEGASTGDITFTGKGKPTYTQVTLVP